jgi:hypothetical protein
MLHDAAQLHEHLGRARRECQYVAVLGYGHRLPWCATTANTSAAAADAVVVIVLGSCHVGDGLLVRLHTTHDDARQRRQGCCTR